LGTYGGEIISVSEEIQKTILLSMKIDSQQWLKANESLSNERHRNESAMKITSKLKSIDDETIWRFESSLA